LYSSEPFFPTHLWITGSASASIAGIFLTGTYWVVNTRGCTTVIDTFHVTFIPQPVVTLGNDTSFCNGNTYVLRSPQPPGSTYVWSNGSTADTLPVSTTGTYWLRVSNGYCSVTDTIRIAITPYPVVNLGPDSFNCEGQPVILQSSVSYPPGATYLWSDLSTGATTTATATNMYWLEVTVSGCPGRDTINVAVISDTIVRHNHMDGRDTICRGTPDVIQRNVNPAATVQWIPTAGVSPSTASSPTFIPDTSAMYIMTVHITGCPDKYDTLTVDVEPNPVVHILGNPIVCQYDTIHLHAAVTPGWYTNYHYGWSPATAVFDDSNATTVVLTAVDTTNFKIFVRVSTPIGCWGSDSAFIIEHPSNFLYDLNQEFDVCPHDSVQFRDSVILFGNDPFTFAWHSGSYLSDSTAAMPWVHPITSQSYFAIVRSQYGCLDTIHGNVTVHPAAQIYTGDSVTIYPGESYHIQPQTNCVNFTWFPAAGLNDSHISDPTAMPAFNTKYKVIGTTEWGCVGEDSISIYFDVHSLLAVPNAFTPGGSVNNNLTLIKRGKRH